MSNPHSLQIYGPSFSNFVRTVMLICEENNVAYSTGFEFDGNTVEFKSKQHQALHPYCKLPIVKHGDFTLSETASICRYIQTTFSSNTTDCSIEKTATIDAFSAIVSIYIDKAIIRDYVIEFAFPKGENGEVRLDVAKEAQPAVRQALTAIDNELCLGNILNGSNLTIADALLAPMLHYISTLPVGFNLLSEFPQVNEYLINLMTRPSCSKVLIAKQ